MHEETLKKFAREQQARAAMRMQQAADKEAALKARLEQERNTMIEMNTRKSNEAATKIDRAAEQRRQMAFEQRQLFHERHVAQQARMDAIMLADERKRQERKRKGKEKALSIGRAQQQQQQMQEQRRSGILNKEAAKQAELDRRQICLDNARFDKQQQRLQQMVASRGRVSVRMSEEQNKMDNMQQQFAARLARVESFSALRDEHVTAAHQMVVRVGLEKQALHYSMRNMRQQVAKVKSAVRLELPPGLRANVQNEQLKALLEQCDPKGQGVISLSTMRSVLSEKLPPTPGKRRLQVSASAPTLQSGESKKSEGEKNKLLAAFREVDTDGNGAISKRELFDKLNSLGIDQHSERFKLFRVRFRFMCPALARWQTSDIAPVMQCVAGL